MNKIASTSGYHLIAVLVVFGILLTAPAFEFQFKISVTGAGTKEVKEEKLVDGKPFIFPVDEFDLAENLKPGIAQFRKERQEKAIPEARKILKRIKDSSTRIDNIVLAGKVLDSDELSDDFYEHYKAELETVKKILSLWVVYSRDISKVKLWNQALRSEIRDPDSKIEKFDAYTFVSRPPQGENSGSLTLSIIPSIFQSERGMGFVDFGRSIGLDPGMQLDIPIVAQPGTSLEILTKDAQNFVDVVGDLLEKYSSDVLYNDLRLYLAESVLRHEIKARWFPDSMPEEIPNALARYALAQDLTKSAEGSQRQEIVRTMSLISPATPDLDSLSRKLKKLQWNKPPPKTNSAEVRRAYSYFLMGAMLLEEKAGTRDIFRQMPPEKLKDPSDFFACLKKVFPECEAGFSAARDWQWKEIQSRISKQEKNEKQTVAVPDSPPPPNYETSQFEGLKIQYPGILKEAVAEIGPAWGKRMREKRQQYNEAISKRPWIRIQALTDPELDRFTSFGLTRPPRKTADQWAELLAKLAEADRLFSVIFTEKIHIWMKEDLQKILQNGGKIEGFSLNEEKNTVNFLASFGDLLNENSYENLKVPGMIASMETVMLPVVLKREEVEGKSKDELAKALLADNFVGSLQTDDTPVEEFAKILGMPLLGMSEKFCFIILVHELAESVITEKLIASDGRRWFTDGMATYIAAEMAGARFGDKEAGWNNLETIFQIDPDIRDEIANQVKLFEWKAGEVEDRLGQGSPTQLSNARYVYSARAIRKAVQGQEDDFLKRWHEEIAKTRWNRTTSQTVIDAYDQLTGGDLRKLVESIAKDDP